MFGGYGGGEGSMNDVYTIDLEDMVSQLIVQWGECESVPTCVLNGNFVSFVSSLFDFT